MREQKELWNVKRCDKMFNERYKGVAAQRLIHGLLSL